MGRYFAIFLCFVMIVVAAGCAGLPGTGLYQDSQSPLVIEQNTSRLQSIDALLRSGKGPEAKLQADLINMTELTPVQLAQFNLLYSQILLNFGEAEQAIARLASIKTQELGITDQIKFFQSQAFAYSLAGNQLESAKARIALDPFLSSPNERRKNQKATLETLGLLPEASVRGAQQVASFPEWFAIAKILKLRNQNPAKFNDALAQWRAANPNHPANIYVTDVKKMPEENTESPNSIAILLPESGPYVDAAKAIKAGFLAAYSRDNSSSIKPILRFYDTELGKASELYQKAVKEGAKVVVGPLNKESIQALIDGTTITTPVLALNHVPNLSRENLYQFALSPIDDVAEITHKAALDGHKNALLLIPENEQSKRIGAYFTESWEAQNGTVLEKQSYDLKTNNLSAAIKKLLNLDAGEDRLKNVTKQFPEVKADAPQPRQDADVLFLSAYNKEGRLVNSQIQTAKLAIYALPAIYSGLPDPANDNALSGITFCDIPWLFNAAYGGELGMMALSDIWRQFPSTYLRLIAMGIDAYQLTSKLTTINTTPYSGATGNLSLSSGNRIKRSLICAKFSMGQPELIGFTHSPSETDYSNANKPSNSLVPAATVKP